MIAGCCLGLGLAGCDDDGGTDAGIDADVSTDAGPMDGGPDPCDGLTLCTTSGTSCSGDDLVTCAANADGCLVETSMDCSAMGGSCDDSGATAMCVDDPCAGVPAADRCTTEGRTCDGEELVDCAANAMGCLVATRTDCAASPGGECDDSGAMVMCVLPADPCAAIPAADRCTTAGTTCSGDTLTTCAADAFGCLVQTTDDCTSRTGGTCDASGAAAVCTATDPCAGITQCAAAGTTCEGPELVTCAADAFGCLVETRDDCTAMAFGFCDAAATPAPVCSTAATDPCMGMTTCSPEGRACTGDSLGVCALNAFGCLVETTTDCAASGEVCDVLDGTAQCGDVCSFRTTCPSATFCDMSDLVSCTTDADGCLIEDTRASCASGTACGGDMCVGNCPSVAPIAIDCGSGTVMGDTAMGSTAITAYAPCTTSTSYAGSEQVFVFRNTGGPADVNIVSTRGASSTGDFDLFVLDGGDGSAACGAADTCVDGSRGVTATETVDFFAPTGDLFYVVYDIFSSTTETSDFSLAVTCTPIVCGDGVVGSGEECDDGATAAGDGCSATCTIESGFVCTGAPSTCRATVCGDGMIEGSETCDDGATTPGDGCSATCTVESGFSCTGAPSVCVARAANATCAGATAVTASTTITGEMSSTGGPRPMGSGCGTSSGNNALYYLVTIPAMTDVVVLTSGTFDRVLLTQNACSDVDCTFRTDSSPERTVLSNDTASPVTRVVIMHNFSSSGSGTYDISFDYVSRIPAACADLSAAPALGVTGDDSASSITALPFTFPYFGDSATHFSATSNGFAQLWTSATGTPSDEWSNGRLPSTSSPDAVLAPFWDDLRPNTGADIYTSTLGSAGSRTFVVEWRNWRASSSGTEDLTFQLHLLEATGEVQFHYCAMVAGASGTLHTGSSATIGAENIGGTDGFTLSQNSSGAVMTGSGFSFVP